MRQVRVVLLVLCAGCAPARPTQPAGKSPASTGTSLAPPAAPRDDEESPAPSEDPPPKKTGASPPDDSSDVDAMLAELDTEDDATIREIPGCLELRGANGCTGVGKVMLVCTALGNVLTETPTRRLVDCLEERSGTPALCETTVLEDCALSAIDQTSATERTEASCRRLLSHCDVEADYRKYLTQARCAAGLASLRSAAREDFVACMNERCDLALCVSGLL